MQMGGGPTAAAISGASARLIDRSVQAPYVSIYARYRSTAPANRVRLAFFPGTRLISDARKQNALRLEVAMSALDSVLPRVAALPWIVSTNVDTSFDRTLGGASIDRSEFFAARRSGQEIPWGVLLSGGTIVDSATGNEGGSIKVAVIDAGVDCDNSDLAGQIYGGYDFDLDYSTGCGFETTHGTAVAGILAATND
jgi:subtilisin family serine protease